MLASKDLPLCSHLLRKLMGLPCYYEIWDRLREQDILHLSDTHEHWHFVKPSSAIGIGQPLLMNPRVTKSKGHPKGSKGKTTTQRDLSAFEIEEAKARGKGRVLCSRK